MANINSNAIRFTINPDNNEEYECLHAITKAISVDGIFDLAKLTPNNNSNNNSSNNIAYDTHIVTQKSDHISLICSTRWIDAAPLCDEVKKIYPYIIIDAATIYEEDPRDMHMITGDTDRLAEDIAFDKNVEITYDNYDTIIVPYIDGGINDTNNNTDNTNNIIQCYVFGFFKPQTKPAPKLYQLPRPQEA